MARDTDSVANPKYSIKGYDLWSTLFKARMRKVTFHSKHEPPAAKQAFCLGDLLTGPPGLGGATQLLLRDGTDAHQTDQDAGRSLLYSYVLDEIDVAADGGTLLNRVARECGSTATFPNGDGVAAWDLLCRLGSVGDNATRIAVARRKLNQLRAKRLPDGCTPAEFDLDAEAYLHINAELPVDIQEKDSYLTTSLMDLMPEEADERVENLRRTMRQDQLDDTPFMVEQLRAIIESLYASHERKNSKPRSALAAGLTQGEASELLQRLEGLEALFTSRRNTGDSKGACSTCKRRHKGPCYVAQPHLMPVQFPGRAAVLALRKEKGLDQKAGSWESQGSPFQPDRKERPKLGAAVHLAAAASCAYGTPPSPDPRGRDAQSLAPLPGKDELVMDSGAEAHFISDGRLMNTYTYDSRNEYVSTASGERVPVDGVGSATVVVLDDTGREIELTLEPAYLVSKLGMNLFSISSAESRGVHTRFEGENVLWSGDVRIPFEHRSTYRLKVKPVPESDGLQAFAADLDTSDMPELVGSSDEEDDMPISSGDLFRPLTDGAIWQTPPCKHTDGAATGPRHESDAKRAAAAQTLQAIHSRHAHASVTRLGEATGVDQGEVAKAVKLLGGVPPCDVCLTANAKHLPHPRLTSLQVSECGEVVSSDLCGPFPESSEHYRYVVGFLDRHSGWLNLQFARTKGEVPDLFRRYLGEVSHLFRVKTLHSDNGGEYTSQAMSKLCASLDPPVRQSFGNPYEPQTNAQIERRWLDLGNMARAMALESGVDGDLYWPFMYRHACYVINHAGSDRNPDGVAPCVMVGARSNDPGLLHPFGCKAVILRTPQDRSRPLSKLAPRGEEGVYLGKPPSHDHGVYVLLDSGTVRISGDVQVTESVFPHASPQPVTASLAGDTGRSRSEMVEHGAEDQDDPEPPAPLRQQGSSTGAQRSSGPSDPNSRWRERTRATAAPLPRINVLTGDDVEGTPSEDGGGAHAAPLAGAVELDPHLATDLDAASDRGYGLGGLDPTTGHALHDAEGARQFLDALAAHPEAMAEPTYLRCCYLTCVDGACLTWSPPSPMRNVRDRVHQALALGGSSPDARTPKRYQEAVDGPDRASWVKAMDTEIDNHRRNGTWRVLDSSAVPSGANLVKSTWSFKIKVDSQGRIARYKARACAQGFSQVAGVDFFDTTSPALRLSSLRTLIALAAGRGWPLQQVDFVAAYLQAELPASEVVYMTPLKGYPMGYGSHATSGPGGGDSKTPSKVLEVRRCIYGLKQSGRMWYQRLRSWLLSQGFTQECNDPCVFASADKDILLGVYVDDLVVTGPGDVKGFVAQLASQFEVEDQGELSYILGTNVDRDQQGISVHQKRYIESLVERFLNDPTETHETPAPKQLAELVTAVDLKCEEAPTLSGEESSTYRSLVCALMFAATVSRPDVAYVVGMLARRLHNPTAPLLRIARRCLAYLNGTKAHGPRYSAVGGTSLTGGYIAPEAIRHSQLEGASDASWEERYSTSGWIFAIGGGPCAWGSRKQDCVALSSTESETMASSLAAQEAVHLRSSLKASGVPCVGPTVLLVDNQSAIALARDPVLFKRSKHISRRHFFNRDCVEDGTIDPVFVPTHKNLADIFTKVLPKDAFLRFRDRLVRPSPAAALS